LEASGITFRVLEPATRASDYVIALERRAGARQAAGDVVSVLHDDGKRIVARVTPAQADTLAMLGLDLQRLNDEPMVMTDTPTRASVPRALSYNPAIATMIGEVQSNTVYTYTGQLSGAWQTLVGGAPYTITTRFTNSGTPVQKATQFVYEHFQALGLPVDYHNWTDCSISNRNVVATQTGTTYPNEIVLIIAHLDDMPLSGVAPGADDNASGSTGVLVIADILSQRTFDRTIRYVLFTGEEQGMCGSGQYTMLVASQNIVAVYNMDMIAWDGEGGPVVELHTRRTNNGGYIGDLALANVFADVVSTYGLGASLSPRIVSDGESRSDHASFWNRGFPAILAIEDDFDFNPYYHKSSDQLARLNMSYYTAFVKASVGTAAHLALHPRTDGIYFLPFILKHIP
jgi:hypothetical protein